MYLRGTNLDVKQREVIIWGGAVISIRNWQIIDVFTSRIK